jgi:hypothetical protein
MGNSEPLENPSVFWPKQEMWANSVGMRIKPLIWSQPTAQQT